MQQDTFSTAVRRNFDFLMDEYGFDLQLQKDSEFRPATDGLVKYRSATTLVSIDGEAGHVAIRFTRIQDDEKYYLDPVSIHEYLNTSRNEKDVLLSTDIKNKDRASEIFRQKYLLTSPGWKFAGQDTASLVQSMLEKYAGWLKQHKALCLIGDFSRWPEFYEYKIDRLIAEELRQGGKPVVRAVVKAEDGGLKTIERPIFQREKEHLEKLRKEISGG